MTAPVHSFLAARPPPELQRSLARLAATEDVVRIAVMPDAHVADGVCVGTVTATHHTLLLEAAGSDLGCGMLALPIDGTAAALADRTVALRLLRRLQSAVPGLRRPGASREDLPDALWTDSLSAPQLAKFRERDGVHEFGTLGRGNHFVEIQRDEDDGLWLLVHSGSRAMGPAIMQHHARRAVRTPTGFARLDADSPEGRAFLVDVDWARRYARANRARIAADAADAVTELLDLSIDTANAIEQDHDHVQQEVHDGVRVWVHRKGAMSLPAGARGVVPGSMGTPTFHVEGRGCSAAMDSSAHGAGRVMRRAEARARVSVHALEQQMGRVVFDARAARDLCEEAPAAYKDIGGVIRAQRSLTRVVRRLVPVLVHKAV